MNVLWEVAIHPAPGQTDLHGKAVQADAFDLGLVAGNNTAFFVDAATGYLIEGDLTEEQVRTVSFSLLTDAVTERVIFGPVGDPRLGFFGTMRERVKEQLRDGTVLHGYGTGKAYQVYVLPKPGVTDTVGESALEAMRDYGIRAEAVRTFKKYRIGGLDETATQTLCTKLLANDAIEQVVIGDLPFDRLQHGSPYTFRLATVPICGMDDAALMKLSKEGQLYLSLAEMQTIKAHFVELQRSPTDVELETIAQTWSEHCSHKTLAGRIHYQGPEGERRFENMLKETIFAATVKIRESLGEADRCVSVFSDNAGVVKFDDEYNVCFKVETHNHPSALEPYGGANTGLGGVIRDPMGTGMGAKPVCSTDVFCFAPPETDPAELPPGVLHPRRIIKGVVSGVRDYGNRMGIPTVNGAVYFDKRYLGNPLVYCGNVGILPKEMSFKQTNPGDFIVAIGGRTGRDGIHGATFSSAELTSESETLSGGAVQIGNAITEKMVLDVLLQARDRGLYTAVTDCGAGGFSSAVGEMGEKIGAEVDLENIPVKYEGLTYTEMWISEAQERMVFSVPPQNWKKFQALCESEDVEATILGVFKPTGRLHLKYKGTTVADLDMRFLHDGRPPVVRDAVYTPPEVMELQSASDQSASDQSGKRERPVNELPVAHASRSDILLKILGSLNVASKHWIIRQYDHEVQAGSVVKPLVGVNNDGPGDAAVVRPRIDSRRGLVVSCGMNPYYGDFDTYHMAASAIDEAVRNCVAVGADPSTIAILDNFCWGNTDRPETLGSLVRAALACYDVATVLGTPFISGKDSLNNEFRPDGATEPISIPPSLLISAMGQVDDVATCTTMDFKRPGNGVYLVGETRDELGGSHYALVNNLTGGRVPTVDPHIAKKTFAAMHRVIQAGYVRSVHDLSEGGLAVALAEMCFAGGFGAAIALPSASPLDADTQLFSESNTRFLCEIEPEQVAAFESALAGIPLCKLGTVQAEPKLTVEGLFDANIVELKAAWLKPLDW